MRDAPHARRFAVVAAEAAIVKGGEVIAVEEDVADPGDSRRAVPVGLNASAAQRGKQPHMLAGAGGRRARDRRGRVRRLRLTRYPREPTRACEEKPIASMAWTTYCAASRVRYN